uniref:Uncharacterized protein n=1 Tax=Lactuca sativa TaxID=4236 RepID=A0A9R1UQI8_LACSA|nr:hypothetical protein LSAT_V11C800439420 [Lactuca sativa]
MLVSYFPSSITLHTYNFNLHVDFSVLSQSHPTDPRFQDPTPTILVISFVDDTVTGYWLPSAYRRPSAWRRSSAVFTTLFLLKIDAENRLDSRLCVQLRVYSTVDFVTSHPFFKIELRLLVDCNEKQMKFKSPMWRHFTYEDVNGTTMAVCKYRRKELCKQGIWGRGRGQLFLFPFGLVEILNFEVGEALWSEDLKNQKLKH